MNSRHALRLLLAAFLMAGTAGARGEEAGPSQAEQQAAVTIRALGVTVRTDDARPGHPVVSASSDFQIHYFVDADVAALKVFKDLRRLSLSYAHITDAGLQELADFKNLQELDLSST